METPKKKILVVEDEAITAQDISDTLVYFGYEVVGIAAGYDEALRLAEVYKPDMALMDIVLQGPHNGTATAIELKNRFNIPVVYLTALADPATLKQASACEPLGYLTKPFSENDLRATMEMAVYKAGMENERRELLRQLQEAHAQIKTLSGLIPICANCKKIRDDKGYWQSVETYIAEHSNASFTHGICSDCFRKLYPDIPPEQT
jgi:AmiR/NasT family two-component response regulator